jgi:lipopolysaccharide/colanic/teichoic acid biosynthesis glycosyltransferase
MIPIRIAQPTIEGLSFRGLAAPELAPAGNGFARGETAIFDATPVRDAPPALLRWIDICQRSARHVLPAGVDLVVGTIAVLLVTKSVPASISVLGTFTVAALLLGLWKPRSSIEAQGILWYARPLVPCTIIVGAGILFADRSSTVTFVMTAEIGFFVALMAVRLGLWLLVGAARRRGECLTPALVVGSASQIDVVAHRMRMYPEAGLEFAAAYVPQAGDAATAASGKDLVEGLLDVHEVEHVVCVADNLEAPVFKDFVRFAGGRADLSIVLPLARLTKTREHLGDLGVIPIPRRESRGAELAKRTFDLIAASMLLVLVSPVLLLTAIAIRIDDPGPAIFRQRRPGRGGRPFTIYKFRSMFADSDARIADYFSIDDVGRFSLKVLGDPRVTRVGAFIRRFSIDELPQLVNVIKGDMSLVGPRPIPFNPDDFDVRAQIRHRVLPGMTGLWQVTGADALMDVDMIELDLTYVLNKSFGLDLLLLLKTIPVLLVRRAPY